jgi:3-hydroxyacyl-CoA dehydrogenase/enoyl-CoA hydratase/carnithine racemase
LSTEAVAHSNLRILDLPEGGGSFAVITLDNGLDRPVTFGPVGLSELSEAVDAALAADVVGIGITGTGKVFCAGADVAMLAEITTRSEALEFGRLGHRIFGRLADLPVPTFAFVNGLALGGGLELALHCTYRAIAENAGSLGLPEISLGLIPGWGGTWLLPNLIGIDAAVEMIVDAPASGRTLPTRQLVEYGLADALLAPERFLDESIAWAHRVLQDDEVVTRVEVNRDQEPWRAATDRSRDSVDKRLHGASPAPYRALDLLAQARTATREQGFAAEDEALADMVMTDECHAAIYAFQLTHARSRTPAGAPDPTLARAVSAVGIVGAGLMASQLALLLATGLGVPVVLTDIDQDRVDQGLGWIRDQANSLQSKGRLSAADAERLINSVTGSVAKSALSEADFVIEAIFENLDVKITMLTELEPSLRDDCVIATNTSSLSVSKMAAVLSHPNRFVGMHFFNPVSRMKLLEIVPTASTDHATLATAFAIGQKLGKSCVFVKDAPGFVVNRLLARLYAQWLSAIDEGTPLLEADHALDPLGLPMSPFALLALIGPAVLLHLGESMAAAWPDRFPVSPNLRAIVDSGVRTVFTKEDPTRVAPQLAAMLESGTTPLEQIEVLARVRDALADEAWRMLDDRVVRDPEDLDLCMLLGAGWPAHLGGITPWLDRTHRQGTNGTANDRRFLPPGVASIRSADG